MMPIKCYSKTGNNFYTGGIKERKENFYQYVDRSDDLLRKIFDHSNAQERRFTRLETC